MAGGETAGERRLDVAAAVIDLPPYSAAQEDPVPSLYDTLAATSVAPSDPWASAGQPNKPSSAVAPGGESFAVHNPFIYSTTSTSYTPIYQVSLLNTRSGEPWQLRLCRLLPSETRRLSMPTGDGGERARVRYDDDLTLYVAQGVNSLLSIGATSQVCIRGCKARALRGTVAMERCRGLMKGPSYQFWHVTAVRARLDAEENEHRRKVMHRRGYRVSDDWKRELLFSLHGGRRIGSAGELEWRDENRRLVATERDERLVATGQMDAEDRDLLIACWVSKRWIQGHLKEADSINSGVAVKPF